MPRIPSFAITKTENEVLYKKYISLGFSPYDASSKINNFVDRLKKMHTILTKQRKSEEDINKKFKQKFEELCQQLEAERVDKKSKRRVKK